MIAHTIFRSFIFLETCLKQLTCNNGEVIKLRDAADIMSVYIKGK